MIDAISAIIKNGDSCYLKNAPDPNSLGWRREPCTFLSLGTGCKDGDPRSLLEWAKFASARLTHAGPAHSHMSQAFASKHLSHLYFRFNPSLDKEVDLDQHDQIDFLVNTTRAYMLKQASMIQRAGLQLIAALFRVGSKVQRIFIYLLLLYD